MPADDRLNDEAREFEAAVARAASWIAEYRRNIDTYPVLSAIGPGGVSDRLPPAPSEDGRPLSELFDDFERHILPGVTHWNHPGFLAYFATTGSFPGILGELLTAALNVNGMVWQSCPALTELEAVALRYLRVLLGLDDDRLFGQILDTASTSSLVAMAAAREAVPGLNVREDGLRGHAGTGPLVMYASEEAHSSIDKAAIVLGIGTRNIRKIPVDSRQRMDARLLEDTLARDADAGAVPFCVVATIGTTGTAAVDPVAQIADVCARHGAWLHVDAAYAGPAAILPEKRSFFGGWERADSIVVNPHKWLFTPMDTSVLYCRHPEVLRRSFSLTPVYLGVGTDPERTHLMDYGFQLGRRFRALKLWMVIEHYGANGLRARLREHIRIAREFADWIEARPEFELAAPTDFSLVCFRWAPVGSNGEATAGDRVDALNRELLERVNATGTVFLGGTTVGDRFTLRCAIGNIQTDQRKIEALEALLLRVTADIDSNSSE